MAYDTNKLTKLSALKSLAEKIKTDYATKVELNAVNTNLDKSFKSGKVEGNKVSLYTSADKSGTAAFTFDFPTEFFFFFMNSDTTWIFVPNSLIQNFCSVGLNLAYANILYMNLPEEKAMVHLDAQKTGRIFENLTLNILKYGLTGSRAYISMEQTEKTVQVAYKNVSAAEINFSADEIMERFKRGDVSRNTEGSGLGLAIVKSFSEAQGGKVQVDLEDDLFKVTVSFPRVQVVQIPVAETVTE